MRGRGVQWIVHQNTSCQRKTKRIVTEIRSRSRRVPLPAQTAPYRPLSRVCHYVVPTCDQVEYSRLKNQKDCMQRFGGPQMSFFLCISAYDDRQSQCNKSTVIRYGELGRSVSTSWLSDHAYRIHRVHTCFLIGHLQCVDSECRCVKNWSADTQQMCR